MQTYDQAGGGPPNTPPPATITQDAADNLQFALHMLNLESAFYHAGITNMTNPTESNIWGSGTVGPINELATLTSLAAQLDVHTTTLLALLSYFGVDPPPTCAYSWPSVENIEGFFKAAQHLSAISLSTLLSINIALAASDSALIATLTPMLTTHARANTFFRTIVTLPPSPTPFDTPLPPAWAFALLTPFISFCESTYKLPSSLTPLPTNPPTLTPLPQPTAPSAPQPALPPSSSSSSSSSSPSEPSTVLFSVDLSAIGFDISPPVSVYLAWLTSQSPTKPSFTPAIVLEGGQIRGQVPEGVNGTAWVALVGKDDPVERVGELAASGTWVAGPAGVDVG